MASMPSPDCALFAGSAQSSFAVSAARCSSATMVRPESSATMFWSGRFFGVGAKWDYCLSATYVSIGIHPSTDKREGTTTDGASVGILAYALGACRLPRQDRKTSAYSKPYRFLTQSGG